MTWQIMDAPPGVFRFNCPETGEIREFKGGFTGLIETYDEYSRILSKVASALGPEVLKAWEDS